MKQWIIILFCVPFVLLSQEHLKGKILDENNPLIGANVQWINTNIGTTSDSNGNFSISKKKY